MENIIHGAMLSRPISVQEKALFIQRDFKIALLLPGCFSGQKWVFFWLFSGFRTMMITILWVSKATSESSSFFLSRRPCVCVCVFMSQRMPTLSVAPGLVRKGFKEFWSYYFLTCTHYKNTFSWHWSCVKCFYSVSLRHFGTMVTKLIISEVSWISVIPQTYSHTKMCPILIFFQD